MRFLIIDKVHPILMERLELAGHQCDYQPEAPAAKILTMTKAYEGLILRSKIRIDKAFIDQNPQLKLIGRVGSGMENIDVEYARSRGIVCLNSPEGNRDSVAEHAVGLILNLLHNVCRANRQVNEGLWFREANRGEELMGKMVGIIGFGNTGSATAERLSALGAVVLAYDKYKSGFGNKQIMEVGLEQIFEHAEIVSLHVPLTSETRYMVNQRFIKRFRKNFYLINTSRGAVVRTSDLVKYLKRGKILGAGLDVLEYERYDFQLKAGSADLEYLRKSPKVILTPHIAGLTRQSFYKLSEVMARKILAVLEQDF